MILLVVIQIYSSLVSHTTALVRTLILAFSAVKVYVRLEMDFEFETLVAAIDRTLEWPIVRMTGHMLFVGILHSALVITVRVLTNKLFLSVVHILLVLSERRFGCELFIAVIDIAYLRLIQQFMHSFEVILKTVVVFRLLSAFGTLNDLRLTVRVFPLVIVNTFQSLITEVTAGKVAEE